jgi:pyruvate dehydrogenase E2 component (dihydrolipoamide acetyltransferase)
MAQKIIMPSGGQTTDEMLILRWCKNPGDIVKKGDVLFEIETDKAAMSVESFADGILLAINFREGEIVKTGEIVAYVGNPGEKLDSEDNSAKQKAPEIFQNSTSEIKNLTSDTTLPNKNLNQLIASPLAKSMAKSRKINLDDVADHFSKNLIKKADIDNYIRDNQNKAAEGDFYFLETSAMRRTIARRMKESILISPHYTVSIDVDMSEVISLRQNLNKSLTDKEIKITYNDILMKIIAKALESFPVINSSYQGERIKVFRDINIGLAVGLEDGLIVPVVKQVNKKSISEISAENAGMIARAKNNKMLESDITGGTITLSNLGSSGINNFTAVINQPESCILAVGAIIEKPVVIDHHLVIKEMMNITGSFDHRVIDGTLGAAFLKKVKEFIEIPQPLLLGLEQ